MGYPVGANGEAVRHCLRADPEDSARSLAAALNKSILASPQGIIILEDVTRFELSKGAELMLQHFIRPLIHMVWPPWAKARLPPPTSLFHGIDLALF